MKKRSKYIIDVIGFALALTLFIGLFYILISDYLDCSEQGGQYVKGLFVMECIK